MGRARKRETWITKTGQTLIDYGVHPGAVLSQYIGWQRPAGGWATIPDPEPDTINVAILAKRPVMLDLDHTYYVRPTVDKRFWISFGRSNNIKETIHNVKEPWIAYWANPKANNPRPYLHKQLPTTYFASDIPTGQRWRYMEQFTE